jgi:hypothetical protein
MHSEGNRQINNPQSMPFEMVGFSRQRIAIYMIIIGFQ